MPKTVAEKHNFGELRIDKSINFCINVFNVGGCLASCLTFKQFLMLDPQQLGCLLKKCIVKLYPLVVLINLSLIIIYYNDSRDKLISKSGKALGMELIFTKI